VADAFEIMSNGRPYKNKMTREEIISEFKAAPANNLTRNWSDCYSAILKKANF